MDTETEKRMREKEVEDRRADLAGFDALPVYLKTQIAIRHEHLAVLGPWGKRVVELYEEIMVLERGLAEYPARRETAAKRLAAAEASLAAMTEEKTEVERHD